MLCVAIRCKLIAAAPVRKAHATSIKKALQPDQLFHVVRKSSEFLRAETLCLAGNWGSFGVRAKQTGVTVRLATIPRSQVL